MNFYENLKSICDSKGLKITPTVLQCGGTKGVISGWKRGVFPNSEIVMQLSVLLNVPSDVLLFGEGKSSSSGLTEDEQELLQLYNELSEKDRTRVMERAKTLHDLAEEKHTVKCFNTIYIKCNQSRVSAGLGDELSDYEQWDSVAVVETPQSRKADFLLIVDGDSMTPLFNDGDYVLIRKQPAVDIGQIGIFAVDGNGYIKKFGGDHLISLNENYDDISLRNREYTCFGLVLGIAETV